MTQAPPSPVDRSQRRFLLACLVVTGLLYTLLDWRFDLPPLALDFRTEEVWALPQGDQVLFWGSYVLASRHGWPRTYTIGFPMIPVADPGLIGGIALMADGRPLPFRWAGDGIVFDLETRPDRPSRVEVAYLCRTGRRSATYITLTARDWPHAVQVATFVVATGMGSNYHAGGATAAAFAPFIPTEDWRVSWP